MTMRPFEPAGEDLLKRAVAHSVAEREMPVPAEHLFALLEEGDTWCTFFPVIRKAEWTSPKPFGEGATRRVTVIGGIVLDEVFWDWKPGRQMGFAVTAANARLMKGLVERYEFVPIDERRCRMRWEMGIEMNDGMGFVERTMPSSLLRTQNWCMGRLERLARERLEG